MTDNLTVCAAAFFRSRGRNIVTEKEFVNEISLNLRWLSRTDAEYLLSALVEKNILVKSGEYFKPMFNLLSIKDVPIGYRPDKSFINELRSTSSPRIAGKNLFSALVVEAEKFGIKKEDFASKAIEIRDKLDIDILVAGLIILKNQGASIDKISDTIYEHISSRPNIS